MTPDGEALHELVTRLFPITRSITGEGVRQTLAELSRRIPMEVTEVPSGTRVLDWIVPREWSIHEAYLDDPDGRRIVDLRDSNLHVVSYSVPVDATMTLDELRPHLHSLPEHPAWTPYRTSYYADAWGFCLPHEQLETLRDGAYRVRIDSSLTDGSLTYGECVLPGETADEVLISCHVCHPSLANDNLSSIAVATFLAAALAVRPHRFTYRFLFAPGTIGAITWLARHEDDLGRIRHGLTLACLGDRGPMTYKRSRRGDAPIDRAVAHVLARRPTAGRVIDFAPYGYDERQFGSPGFDLPVGSLSRTPYAEYPEYHTSADDLAFVTPDALADSLATLWQIVELLERDRTYRNLSPRGEPQLGRRGLYPSTGGAELARRQLAMLWVLNQSDGRHSLLEIAERSGMELAELADAAEHLAATDLLEPEAQS
jgi:aminopeptidase-like protein